MRLKTLIADDEPLARERLRFLLSSDEEIEIAGECRHSREVVTVLREQKIDVLFLDIQMPGGGGFEVVGQLGTARMPVTVFVTAHNQYAVQAFEVHALDYLTKPVEPERLGATLVRVKERIASNAALLIHEQLYSVLRNIESGSSAQKEYPKRLLIHNGRKDSFVSVKDIEWIEAADYYSCLHVGPKNFLLRETIKQLANSLDQQRFVRIHRSVIVNVEQVREIVREGQNEGMVILTNGQRLRMSKAGWQNLLRVSRI
jgi:two-component system LytT family response regulator